MLVLVALQIRNDIRLFVRMCHLRSQKIWLSLVEVLQGENQVTQ